MNKHTSSRDWLPGIIGIAIGGAIAAAFFLDAEPAGAGAPLATLLDGAALGHAVGELLALALSTALLAFGLRQLTARSSWGDATIALGSIRRTPALARSRALRPAVAMPADARRPALPHVTSLVEAQLARQQAKQRRQETGAARKSA